MHNSARLKENLLPFWQIRIISSRAVSGFHDSPQYFFLSAIFVGKLHPPCVATRTKGTRDLWPRNYVLGQQCNLWSSSRYSFLRFLTTSFPQHFTKARCCGRTRILKHTWVQKTLLPSMAMKQQYPFHKYSSCHLRSYNENQFTHHHAVIDDVISPAIPCTSNGNRLK